MAITAFRHPYQGPPGYKPPEPPSPWWEKAGGMIGGGLAKEPIWSWPSIAGAGAGAGVGASMGLTASAAGLGGSLAAPVGGAAGAIGAGATAMPALTLTSPALGAASVAGAGTGISSGLAAGASGLGGSLTAGGAASTGAAAGAPLGPIGVVALTVAGALVGALLGDWFADDPEPPKKQGIKPAFTGGSPYHAGSGSLSDPGGSPGVGQSENIRLGAATNIQSSLSGY